MSPESLCADENGINFAQSNAPTTTEAFEKYSDMVYRLAFARTKSKYDADDILQEVFIRYQRNEQDIRSQEHCKAWLIKVTLNCTKSLLTSSWFRKIIPLKDNINTNIHEDSEVYYSVMALPVKYRTVIHLFYYEDYTVNQIAGLMDVKDSTVKSWLFRARNILRNKLKGEDF